MYHILSHQIGVSAVSTYLIKLCQTYPILTGLRSAVCNVSGNRCESDCRSRGREFDRGLVPFFLGDYEIISKVFLLPSAESFKKDCCQLQAKVCA